MKTRAAVAIEAGKPLEIMEVDLDGPRAGEVLVEIMATGICHTDEFTLSGADPEGMFPAILGHEGAGIVREIGAGVKSVAVGDHVIPLYTPECRECDYCLHPKTNLCQAIRGTQGQGVMPDGTSRFSLNGKPILHYMGTSTFSNFTVLPEIAVAKVNKAAPFDKICYIGCGGDNGHWGGDQYRESRARMCRCGIWSGRYRAECDSGAADDRRKKDCWCRSE